MLIRLSSLGDILLLTPALRALRTACPEARIDVLLSQRYQDLLEGNPHVSNLLLFPDRGDSRSLKELASQLKERYQVVVDLHTSLRSFYLRRRLRAQKVLHYRKRRLARWLLVKFKVDFYGREFSVPQAYLKALESLGVKDDGGGLEWPAAQNYLSKFLQIAGLGETPQPKPIALCPGASHFTKRWPEGRWRELAFRLLESEPALWVFGDQNDSQVGELLYKLHPERVTNFCGKLGVAQAGAGLSLCRLAITHDAGPAHMAAAVGIPVLAIFGSTVTQFGFRPFRVPHCIAEVDLPCRPCSHLGYAACPLTHFRCMKDVTAGRVMELLADLSTEQTKI